MRWKRDTINLLRDDVLAGRNYVRIHVASLKTQKERHFFLALMFQTWGLVPGASHSPNRVNAFSELRTLGQPLGKRKNVRKLVHLGDVLTLSDVLGYCRTGYGHGVCAALCPNRKEYPSVAVDFPPERET